MDAFAKFNPFEASKTKAAGGQVTDPRTPNLPAPTQPEPMRGVEGNLPEGQTPNSASTNKSPVDIMEEVWNTEVKPDESHNLKTLDNAQVKTLSEKFTPDIKTEDIEAAMSDPEKFRDMLVKVSRESFEAASNVSSSLASNYIEQERSSGGSRMQKELQKTNALAAIQTINPTLTSSGPFKDMTEGLVTKYLAKFPGATPREVADNVNGFISAKLGIEQKAKDSPEKKEAPEENWETFLDSDD